jgi:hypothetical protein
MVNEISELGKEDTRSVLMMKKTMIMMMTTFPSWA